MADTLFSMTEAMKDLVAMSDSLDPEDEQLFLDTLEAVKGEIGLKIDSYKYVMDQIKAKADMIKSIKEEADQKIKACNNALDRMKSAVFDAVDATPPDEKGKKHIDGKVYKASIVKNGGNLPLVIDGEVPENYQKIIYETDRVKIYNDLKNGKELPFAHLGERGVHLVVR